MNVVRVLLGADSGVYASVDRQANMRGRISIVICPLSPATDAFPFQLQRIIAVARARQVSFDKTLCDQIVALVVLGAVRA